MLAADNELVQSVASEINGHNPFEMSVRDVRGVLLAVFVSVTEDAQLIEVIQEGKEVSYDDLIGFALRRFRSSTETARIGYERTALTSRLVGEFIAGISFAGNENAPWLSKVDLDESTRRKVEVLKRFAYVSLIQSSRLKIAEYRGQEIVEGIFRRLAGKNGFRLLPEDYCRWYQRLPRTSDKMRVICDFIAGMTDRYAVEFHARLNSETPQSIFKPL
jgi:dGTPase